MITPFATSRDETRLKHDQPLRKRHVNVNQRGLSFYASEARIISDSAKAPTPTTSSDWRDATGHHGYYGSSASNGGERPAETRRGLRICPQRLRLLIAHGQARANAAHERKLAPDPVLPYLLLLADKEPVAKQPCFISSLLTLLMTVEPYGAGMSWLLGMIVAVVAMGFSPPTASKKRRRDFSRRVDF